MVIILKFTLPVQKNLLGLQRFYCTVFPISDFYATKTEGDYLFKNRQYHRSVCGVLLIG